MGQNKWGIIGDLQREYVWTDFGGGNEEFEKVATRTYRAGELVLFSPLVENFYRNRRRGWTVEGKCSHLFFEGTRVLSARPRVEDLTRENSAFVPSEYDFNESKRLALVCDAFQKGGFPQYRLLPLKNEEYRSKAEGLVEYSSFRGLNAFDDMIKHRFVDVGNIPIEIIARRGEIDQSKLVISKPSHLRD